MMGIMNYFDDKIPIDFYQRQSMLLYFIHFIFHNFVLSLVRTVLKIVLIYFFLCGIDEGSVSPNCRKGRLNELHVLTGSDIVCQSLEFIY